MPGNRAKDGVLIKTITVDLPPPHTNRWVPRRKAAIAYAVSNGAITLEEVCRRYHLSVEEFLAWTARYGDPWRSWFARHSATDPPRSGGYAGRDNRSGPGGSRCAP